MGTTPPEMMMPTQQMAGGGMVSFKQGGDVVQRFSQGDFIGLPIYREPSSGPAGSMGELFSNMIPSMSTLSNVERRIDPVTGKPVTLGEYLRLQDERRAAAARREMPSIAASSGVAGGDAENQRGGFYGGVPSVAAAPAAAPAGIAVAPPVSSAFMNQQKDLLKRFRDYKEPTAEELETARASGRSEFESQMPFRMGYMEDYLKSQASKLRGREESNVNEALITAGLGIMGSKSPRFLQAVSEGGLSALKAYKEGQKDIRQGERDLMQSRGEYAKAQTLYDAGKYEAGQKAEQRGLERYKSGMERLNTESAIVARLGAQEEALAKSGREAAKLPYDLAESAARTKYYTDRPQALDKSIATPDQITQARAQAMVGLPKGASQAQIEAQLDAILAQSGLRRATAPATTQPLNRGTL
jgi:hypothetical protein